MHGVADEGRLDRPSEDQIKGIPPYAVGYLAGFADARGPDVCKEQWWKTFGSKLEYQWWKEKD